MLFDEQKLTLISYVWTLDAVLSKCQEWWPTETEGKIERESERERVNGNLAVGMHDDDDYNDDDDEQKKADE